MRSPFYFFRKQSRMNQKRFEYSFGERTYNFFSRTHIMGILNVTPDSFYDGGMYFDSGRAVERALEMINEGADIIDVGGESTRPKSSVYGDGADVVDAEEELRRVLPVITKLAGQTDVPISIDTYKSEVALRALEAGATIVNDISGFRFDARMPEAVARMEASVVIMHTQGTPKTMQMNPSYENLIREVRDYLHDGIILAKQHGIKQIIIDPGIGFGKTHEDSLRLLNRLSEFKSLEYPILVGASRKSFIGKVLDLPIEKRLEGSLAVAACSVLLGANIVRVHDVIETKYVVTMADAIKNIGLN